MAVYDSLMEMNNLQLDSWLNVGQYFVPFSSVLNSSRTSSLDVIIPAYHSPPNQMYYNQTNFMSPSTLPLLLSMNSTIFQQSLNQTVSFILQNILPTFVWESLIFSPYFSVLLQLLLANQLIMTSFGLVLFSKLGGMLSDWYGRLRNKITTMFYYTVVVKEYWNGRNIVYDALITWMSKVDHFKDSKHLDAFIEYHHIGDEDSSMGYKLVPGDGYYQFKHEGNTIYFSREFNRENNLTSKSLTLSVHSFNGRNILKSIIEEAIKCHTHHDDSENTSIYNFNAANSDWTLTCVRPCRTFDSVYLDEQVKSLFLKDLERFLSNKTFYMENQLSYKRGYCLFGLPGSGKTSLILATASYIKCPIYILSLNQSEMSDTAIIDAFSSIPTRSIIVLEDIDAAFNEKRKTGDLKNALSFSGLLNALDGVCTYSETPKLVFMTTNHIERLDPALIRPGRVDYKIKFGCASAEQIRQISFKFFKNQELAQSLSEQGALHKFTISEIQTFLLRYIETDPKKALDDVSGYVKEVEMLRKEQE